MSWATCGLWDTGGTSLETKWECMPSIARFPAFEEKLELWTFCVKFPVLKTLDGWGRKKWVCDWILSAGHHLLSPEHRPWFRFTRILGVSRTHYLRSNGRCHLCWLDSNSFPYPFKKEWSYFSELFRGMFGERLEQLHSLILRKTWGRKPGTGGIDMTEWYPHSSLYLCLCFWFQMGPT